MAPPISHGAYAIIIVIGYTIANLYDTCIVIANLELKFDANVIIRSKDTDIY